MGLFSWLTTDDKKKANTPSKLTAKTSKAMIKAIEAEAANATDSISKSAVIAAGFIVQQQAATIMKTDETKGNQKAKRKAQKKQFQWRDVKEPVKYVNQKGKIFCPFCTVPIGDFLVTSTQVKLQDTFQVTAGDKMGAPMPNLVFKGQCIHPCWTIAPPPCIGVIQPSMWKDTSETIIDVNRALLRKSTIPCMISQQDIQIVHSGQQAFIPEVKIKSIHTKFRVTIKKVETDYFLPLGIKNPKKEKENISDHIKIKFRIRYQAAKEYEIQIYDKDSKLIWQEFFLQGVTITANRSVGNNLIFHDPQDSEDTYPVGDYTYEWDGFDLEGNYDSTRMLGELTFKIIGKSYDGKESEDEKTVECEYAEQEYVDILINKYSKTINVTIRIDFQDGGTKGLNTGYIAAPDGARVKDDWEIVPQKEINQLKKEPLKTRTKTYDELLNLAYDGIKKYWSRNGGNTIGTNIEINGETYEVWTNPVDAKKKCTDDISLVFMTNYDSNSMFSRSSNPGRVRDWYSFWANFAAQRVLYAVGYYSYKFKNGNISWYYDDDSSAEKDFKYTAAHELGHEILSAFGGGEYSMKHKGTSTFIFQERLSSSTLPESGEVDLMKYYNGEDLTRTIAAEEDVIGLIWLSKIEID